MLTQARQPELSSPANKSRNEESRLLARTLPLRRELLCDLANTDPAPDPVKWFQEKWHGRIREESLQDLMELGEELRAVWKRPRIRVAEKILDKWLAWRPLAATFRKYKGSDIDRLRW
jgi:hypothetical protein